MNTKINSYINFAVRSNKVLFGLDNIKSAKKKPYIIIYDDALSQNSKNKMLRYADENKIFILEVEKDYLNILLKRNNVKLIGLLDESLSNAIIENVSIK